MTRDECILGLAIIAALNGGSLYRADLRYANLRSANLRSADLRSADLRSADLRYANLRYADLSYADLRSADLRSADLRYANLRYADLSYANLRSADLRSADLRSADLSYANLRYADLSYANLRYAKIERKALPPFQIPQDGELTVYKAVQGGVCKLLIPADAKRTASVIGRKCRAEFVKVLEAPKNNKGIHDSTIVYAVGEIVRPDKYDDDPLLECTNGIHFFLTKEEAEAYR